MVCASGSPMGPTLAYTHAILMPTREATNIGTNVATRGAPHARLMPTLGAPNVGTLVATQESCQVFT